MAQSESFFGLRRGSTKTLTFSVYNGKQVTKDRVAVVKNPRSALQMKQRAIMATAMHGYSALKEICDHSFEGITYGQKSMNYFLNENARMIRATAPKVNLSSYKGISVSNAYIIAKGSLNKIQVEAIQDDTQKKFSIFIGTPSDSWTLSDLMKVLGATEIGDMVTFVNLVDNPGGNASVYWLRIKLSETNKAKSLGVSGGSAGDILVKLVEGEDFETNIANFTNGDFPLAIDGSSMYVGSGSTTSTPISQSLGVIVSRKSDTGWLRSPSTMVNLFDTFNYNEALTTYPESGEKILNGGNV